MNRPSGSVHSWLEPCATTILLDGVYELTLAKVVKSLEVLYQGLLHKDKTHKFCLTEIRGDWKFQKENRVDWCFPTFEAIRVIQHNPTDTQSFPQLWTSWHVLFFKEADSIPWAGVAKLEEFLPTQLDLPWVPGSQVDLHASLLTGWTVFAGGIYARGLETWTHLYLDWVYLVCSVLNGYCPRKGIVPRTFFGCLLRWVLLTDWLSKRHQAAPCLNTIIQLLGFYHPLSPINHFAVISHEMPWWMIITQLSINYLAVIHHCSQPPNYPQLSNYPSTTCLLSIISFSPPPNYPIHQLSINYLAAIVLIDQYSPSSN